MGLLICGGQLGRGLGPVLFTSVYWWAGRQAAYRMGSLGISAVALLVLNGLRSPPGSVKAAKGKATAEKKEL